ncbi:MAG: hypothetical protein GY772_17370 [bacterium]|nr:hypothetical protein [bacterium]
MKTGPGGLYRVSLVLSNAAQTGPSWLVGATVATYPGAAVVSVEEYSVQSAVILVKWIKGEGDISNGDQLSLFPEGTQLPGYAAPEGVVTEVEQIQAPSVPEEKLPNPLRLAGAGAILLTVAYLSRKIGDASPKGKTTS